MKSTEFSCEIIAKSKTTKARVIKVTTPHGAFTGPIFMPVGTRAGVNNMMPQELLAAKSQIILGGNTYHMLCAPGMRVIREAKGMHAFMGWSLPMLTDSGGFQIFSLSENKEICTIDDEGAHFVLPRDRTTIHMTPAVSLHTQKTIGADIIMAFDQCTPDAVSKEEAHTIMARTHRWLEESILYHQANPTSLYGDRQALFGIIQGGIYTDLRQESAQFVAEKDLDGIAIGGESIGFDMALTVELLRTVEPYLPEHKPRYSMGVGMSPQDLLDVAKEGVDMFDCVAPTRNARHGALYCGEVVEEKGWLRFQSPFEKERLQIKKACFSTDFSPIMPGCDCYTCTNYTRAYLHQLCKQKAPLFSALASIHNVHVMLDVCAKMQAFILSQQESK